MNGRLAATFGVIALLGLGSPGLALYLVGADGGQLIKCAVGSVLLAIAVGLLGLGLNALDARAERKCAALASLGASRIEGPSTTGESA